jgi:Tol biopolymer transport system component
MRQNAQTDYITSPSLAWQSASKTEKMSQYYRFRICLAHSARQAYSAQLVAGEWRDEETTMRRRVGEALVLGFSVTVATGAGMPARAHGTTERVSVSSGGVQADGESFNPAISGGGRSVAFHSNATNLVPGDTNDTFDVFVRDRGTGMTRRVSVGPGGAQADEPSADPALSRDGRFVAFGSDAANLVPGDTNGTGDIFVRDRQAGTTRRVSVGPGGAQANGFSSAPTISADGRFVGFHSFASNLVPGDTNGTGDVFVRNRQTGATRRVSVGLGGAQGNGFSGNAAISADGRFVAFQSSATNLVPGGTNGQPQVFVRDRQAGTTWMVSVGPGGVQGDESSGAPALSADGRFIAFESFARNLVSGDTNFTSDVFIRDREAGTTRRVSVGPGGAQADNAASFGPEISADGRLRRLSVIRRQLGARRHQRRLRRVRPRPPSGHYSAGQRRAGRYSGRWDQLRAGAVGERARRRLQLARHKPGVPRHE